MVSYLFRSAFVAADLPVFVSFELRKSELFPTCTCLLKDAPMSTWLKTSCSAFSAVESQRSRWRHLRCAPTRCPFGEDCSPSLRSRDERCLFSHVNHWGWGTKRKSMVQSGLQRALACMLIIRMQLVVDTVSSTSPPLKCFGLDLKCL